jgi:hypothetical protein
MRRSEINAAIKHAEAQCAEFRFALPDFAQFTPQAWKEQDLADWREVLDCELGWDVTDFGTGRFESDGLTLFTLRNGHLHKPEYVKTYAEKILFIGRDQVTPCHFHAHKMEDICNRGGGDLVMQLHHATPEGGWDEKREVVISVDGHRVVLPAGGHLRLRPGQSVCLYQRLYHNFWAEKDAVLGWEVSMVNDDHNDNFWLTPRPRFSSVIEDEDPRRVLCNEYGQFDLR